MSRTIIAKFEIDDNDFIEQKLFDSLQCHSLKDFKSYKDTKELYENDATYKKLVNMKIKAQKSIDDYLNKIAF